MMSRGSRNFRKVTHCIFDMDGLLLDTEKLYTQATQTILDKYGKIYTWDFKMTVMGLQTQQVSEKIVKHYELPMTWQEYAKLQREINESLMANAELMPDTEVVYEEIVRQIAGVFGKSYPSDVRFKILGTTQQRSAEIAVQDLKLPISVEDYLKRYTKLCGQMLGNTPLLKGANRLLCHLHENKVPIALATSSGKDMVEVKTTHHRELFSLFNHRVCGSTDPGVKNGKPAPDIFLVAAQRFPEPVNPEDCLVFEDAPNGVQAAISAGMQVVMVPDPRCPEEMTRKATQVLKSLEDFCPQEFGLPPFKN